MAVGNPIILPRLCPFVTVPNTPTGLKRSFEAFFNSPFNIRFRILVLDTISPELLIAFTASNLYLYKLEKLLRSLKEPFFLLPKMNSPDHANGQDNNRNYRKVVKKQQPF